MKPLTLHLSGESVYHPVRRHGGPHSTTLKEKNIKNQVCSRSAKLPYCLCDKYKVFKEAPDGHPQVSQLTGSEGSNQGATFIFQHSHHFGPEKLQIELYY